MPIDSPEKYSRAETLVADERTKPEVRAALKVQMATFRSSNPQMSGALGPSDSWESTIGGNPEMKQLGAEERARSHMANAINASPVNLRGVPDQTMSATNAELDAQEARMAEQEAERAKNEKLPNASKDPNVPPPEYTAGDKPGGPSIADAMPALIGGRVHMWNEPTVAEFHRDVGPILAHSGRNPAQYDENSLEFKQYADLRWTQAFQTARATQTPIVRVAFARQGGINGLGDAVDAAGEKANQAFGSALAAASGALGGILPGSPDAISSLGGNEATEVTRQNEERHPLLTFAGGMLGGAQPGSVLSRVTGGVSKAIGGAAPGLARSMLASGVGAAAGAGAQAGISNAVGQGVDIAQGERPSFDTGELGRTAGNAALTGLGLGAALELPGAGAQRSVDSLRSGDRGSALRALENAGGGTSAVSGVRLPASVRANEAAALSSGTGHPIDYAAEKVTSPLADQATQHFEATKARIQAETADAHAALDGQTVTTAPLGRKLMDMVLRRRSSDSGGELPFARSQPFMKALQKTLRVDVVAKPPSGVPSDATIITPQEAEGTGLLELPAVKQQLERVGQRPVMSFNELRPPGQSYDPGVRIVVRPIDVTVKEMDQIIGDIDDAGRLESPDKSRVNPDFLELGAAAREARDQFRLGSEPGGYSAMKGRHETELGDLTRSTRDAGLPGTPRPQRELTAEQRAEFGGNVRNFGNGEGRLAKDQALMQLAQKAGPEVEQGLREVAATRFGRQLAEQQRHSAENMVSLNPFGLGARARKFLEYRKDPAMQAFASAPKFETLPPSVADMLAGMRRDPSQLAGMRGGQLGARIAGSLTPEDIENLSRLLHIFTGTASKVGGSLYDRATK